MNKGILLGFITTIASIVLIGALIPDYIAFGEETTDGPVFNEIADSMGLHHRGETWGWAWGDFDDDGYIDLFLANHPETALPDATIRPYMMRNDGGNGFTDVIVGTGMDFHEDFHDSPIIDYDNDGDMDIFISVGGRGGTGVPGPNFLFRQEANGTFNELAASAGLDIPLGRGRGTVFLDYNGDHDLDFFFTSAPQDTGGLNALYYNNGSGIFNKSSQPEILASSGSHTNVSVGDYDNDGSPDIYVTDQTALYRYDGRDYEATHDTAGVNSEAVQAADWGDYDDDGDLDLFLSRGRTDLAVDYWGLWGEELLFAGRAELDEDGLIINVEEEGDLTLYLQQKLGRNVSRELDFIYVGQNSQNPTSNPFTLEYGETSGSPSYTPGQSLGIYIWQSDPGIYNVYWSGNDGTYIRYSGIITTNTSFGTITEYDFEYGEPNPIPNQLFQNQGDGTFIDVAAAAGVDDTDDCRGADWGDYDNDGDLDIFVQTFGWIDDNIPNHLYRNNGDGTFTDVAEQAGVTGERLGSGWGALWADYDNDGFLDLLTSQESFLWPLPPGSYELFHNEGNDNNWLEVDLRGVTSNSRGYGTRLWLTVGGKTQYRQYNDSSHHFSHYAGPVHFGLGQATSIDILRIEWPSGQVDEHYNLPINRRYTVEEGREVNIWLKYFLPFLIK